MSDKTALALTRATKQIDAAIGEQRAQIEKSTSVAELKSIRDKASAMQQYAKQIGVSLQAQNGCAEIKLRAERGAGAMLASMAESGERSKGGQPRKEPSQPVMVLSDIGISLNQAHRWQREASLPEEKFVAYVAEVNEAGSELTQAGLLRAATGAHVSANSGDNEWYTPAAIIELAREHMGGIDLDPASSDAAQATVNAGTYYTEHDDGLAQEWSGRVWLNPPYAAKLIGLFIEKVATAFEAGKVSEACVLVNNATDTKWFQRLSGPATAVCFPDTRVRFTKADGKRGAPLQGQAVVYLGARPADFVKIFKSLGQCWRR